MKFFIAILAVAHAAKDAHNAGPLERPAQLVKIEAPTVDICVDSDWIDIGNDGCDWYWDNMDGCGDWDTDLGSAWDECCACGGGTDSCADEWVDSFGDACDWYWDNMDGCGVYDTDCGSAWDECFACSCDTSGWVDSGDDGCDWYYDNVDQCGDWDTDLGSAWDECCACA